MRALLQRVVEASVEVDGRKISTIGQGLLALVGVAESDTRDDVRWLVEKTLHLRVFPDEKANLNRSLIDTGYELLVVSQFTLLADCQKGRRPSFAAAAPPEKAKELYEFFVQEAQAKVRTQTGQFQAMMKVSLINDGPVTLLLDSKQ